MEELEKKKIQTEIDHITALTEELKSKNTLNEQIAHNRIKRWMGSILSLISVIAAIIGIIIPLNNFLVESNNKLQYELNENMINLVDNLDSQSKLIQLRSMILLSYYEENSLKVLLFQLYQTSPEDKVMLYNIIDLIVEIFKVNNKEVRKQIDFQLDRLFERLNPSGGVEIYLGPLENLFITIQKLPLKRKDLYWLDNLIERSEKELDDYEKELNDHEKQDLITVRSEINKCKKLRRKNGH